LGPACGTLVFRGTVVGNHWTNATHLSILFGDGVKYGKVHEPLDRRRSEVRERERPDFGCREAVTKR